MNFMLSKLIPGRATFQGPIVAKADELEAQHGAQAWAIAYAAMRRIGSTKEDFRVLRLIEQRRGINRQPDTATRYLEGNYDV